MGIGPEEMEEGGGGGGGGRREEEGNITQSHHFPLVPFDLVIPDDLLVDMRVKLALCLIHLSFPLPPSLLPPVLANPEEYGDLFLDLAEAYSENGQFLTPFAISFLSSSTSLSLSLPLSSPPQVLTLRPSPSSPPWFTLSATTRRACGSSTQSVCTSSMTSKELRCPIPESSCWLHTIPTPGGPHSSPAPAHLLPAHCSLCLFTCHPRAFTLPPPSFLLPSFPPSLLPPPSFPPPSSLLPPSFPPPSSLLPPSLLPCYEPSG